MRNMMESGRQKKSWEAWDREEKIIGHQKLQQLGVKNKQREKRKREKKRKRRDGEPEKEREWEKVNINLKRYIRPKQEISSKDCFGHHIQIVFQHWKAENNDLIEWGGGKNGPMKMKISTRKTGGKRGKEDRESERKEEIAKREKVVDGEEKSLKWSGEWEIGRE